MASRLLMLLALVIVIAAVWAALVALFSTPLTLGWREFFKATVRRWVWNVAVLGVGAVIVLVASLAFLTCSARPIEFVQRASGFVRQDAPQQHLPAHQRSARI